jgi:hypothetical protein
MNYYEINLLECKLIKIKITQVKRWCNLYSIGTREFYAKNMKFTIEGYEWN